MHTRKHSGLLGSILLLMTFSLTVAGRLGAQVATSPPASPSIAGIPGLTATLNGKASLPGLTPLVAPLVATHTTANLSGRSGGTDTTFNFQSNHILTADVTALKITWENPAASPITLTAAVWLPGGSVSALQTPLQVTWNGATSVTIPASVSNQPVSTVTSDWITPRPAQTIPSYTYITKTGTDSGAFNLTTSHTTLANGGAAGTGYLPLGMPFYVREYVTGTAGQIPLGMPPGYNSGEGSSHSTTDTDETMLTNSALTALTPAYAGGNLTGGWQSGYNPPDSFTGGNTPALIFCPSAIQGQTVNAPSYSVIIFGDSISNGTGDQWQGGVSSSGVPQSFQTTYSQASGAGAIVRALEQSGVPYVQAGIYGASFGGTDAIFWPYAPGCTHTILQMGINYIRSVSDGTSNANVAANTTVCVNSLKGTIASLKRRNPTIKCILWTYPPTTAPDGKSAAGTGQATRVSINDYIRANYAAMGAVDYIDAANAVESTSAAQGTLTQNGGAWYNGGTGLTTVDGTHPSNYGHGLIAAAIVAKINAGMLAK